MIGTDGERESPGIPGSQHGLLMKMMMIYIVKYLHAQFYLSIYLLIYAYMCVFATS